jgi:hypothetical protein
VSLEDCDFRSGLKEAGVQSVPWSDAGGGVVQRDKKSVYRTNCVDHALTTDAPLEERTRLVHHAGNRMSQPDALNPASE